MKIKILCTGGVSQRDNELTSNYLMSILGRYDGIKGLLASSTVKITTPLPHNPTVVLLTDDHGKIVKMANNIAPMPEIKVELTSDPILYKNLADGKPYNQNTVPTAARSAFVY